MDKVTLTMLSIPCGIRDRLFYVATDLITEIKNG